MTTPSTEPTYTLGTRYVNPAVCTTPTHHTEGERDEMKTYTFAVDIEDARGSQCFSVKADGVDEALKKLRNGEGEFVSEEIEVTGLNFRSPTLIEETP